MTTIALDAIGIDAEIDVPLARAEDEAVLPASVANPRRTIWTGYAKNASDRLPSV